MPVQSQFALEQLSEKSRALVHRMLDEGKGPTAIARALREQAEQKVAVSAITRYAASYWERQQQRQRARQHTEQLVEQAGRQGTDISELLRAAFLEGFTEAGRNGTLREMNPLQLETAHRKRRELALKERQMRLAERRVELLEQKWQFDRKKAEAAIEKLDRKARSGKPITERDIKRIQEIYGMRDEWQKELDEIETSTTVSGDASRNDEYAEEN